MDKGRIVEAFDAARATDEKIMYAAVHESKATLIKASTTRYWPRDHGQPRRCANARRHGVRPDQDGAVFLQT